MVVMLLSQCAPCMCRMLQEHKRAACSAEGMARGFVPCPSDRGGHGFGRFRVLSPRFTCLYRFAVVGFTNAQGSLSDIWESLCRSHLLSKDAFWAVTGSRVSEAPKATVPGRLIQYRDRPEGRTRGAWKRSLARRTALVVSTEIESRAESCSIPFHQVHDIICDTRGIPVSFVSLAVPLRCEQLESRYCE